jgi:hypothetical protein
LHDELLIPISFLIGTIVTKDSAAADGELKGDILRATTCWSVYEYDGNQYLVYINEKHKNYWAMTVE